VFVVAWRDRQRATIRSVTKSLIMRLKPGCHHHRAVARMGTCARAEQLIAFAEAHQIPIAKDKRGEAPFLGRRQSFARFLGRQGARGIPRWKCPITSIRAPSIRRRRRTRRPSSPSISKKGRCDRHRRQEAVARDRCWRSSTNSAMPTVSDGSTSWKNRFVGMKSRGMYETPGRHHSARSPIAVSNRSRSIAGAAHLKDELMPKICRARLQRLLVFAGARDAAGGDRSQPAICDRAACG